MTITKHQKEVIRLIKEEGFVLKNQHSFGNSWWLLKNLKGGYINSKDVLHSTARNLLNNKLIELKMVDKYKHHYYKLTKLGKQISNSTKT